MVVRWQALKIYRIVVNIRNILATKLIQLWRPIHKIYMKSFWAIVLMLVIRQCLYIDTNPCSSTQTKFIPVVTWNFELLKTFIFSPVFTVHEE